jgi:hypothetical protein
MERKQGAPIESKENIKKKEGKKCEHQEYDAQTR